jgi:CubicO group peptidase (beta-lactamase class C family)
MSNVTSSRSGRGHDRFPRAAAAVEAGIGAGLHPGGQVYVSRNGEVLLDAAWGSAREGVPMEPGTVQIWLSAGKPVVAAAVLHEVEEGRLGLDDPVVHWIPGFGVNGKEGITVRHLLTHTAGFRTAEAAGHAATWDETIGRICRSRLEEGWVPGQKAGYHFTVSWFVLGEILRRVTGKAVPEAIRDTILLPCGMNGSHVSFAPDEIGGLLPRMGLMHVTSRGKTELHPTVNRSEELLKVKPGSGLRGPAHDLGLFYEMLLNKGEAGLQRVLQEETVRAMTSRQRRGMFDETFKQAIDWGFGVIINRGDGTGGQMTYGFGDYASPETFGHGGSQSSTGFADPRHGLAVAAVFNGQPGEAAHAARMRGLCNALYADLGLA